MGNSSGKRSASSASRDRPKKNVHWKSAEAPSAPGKPMLLPTFDVPTEALTIKWERPADGGSPIIGYLVEQRRVGSPTWYKAAASLVAYPELVMTSLEPGRRYQFRVFAQNVVGISESSLFSDPIAIPLPNANVVPQFLNELQDTIVLENDQCEFNVSVVGAPVPQINWFKDGFEIFSSRRTKIINDRGNSTLIIHQAALTDEGEIKCTATNRAGHVVTRMRLRIEAPPKIRLPRQYEDGFLVEAGEVIKLKVGIAGRPTPSIAWMHNGEIITNNDGRYEITTNDKNSFLKIKKAQRSDRGEYNVRAVNKLGEFNASFLVTVTAKPSPPENVRITMSLGKSVTLTWVPPHDDGGCKIGNYIVEYYRIGWNVWLKASSTRQLTTTLNDLINGSEYKFRVKAESPYGLSEPSAESRILFVPDHKRGIISPSRDLTAAVSASAARKSTDREDKATTVNQIVIAEVPKNVELISQIYDDETIARELNYGTKVDIVYKRKEISSSNAKSEQNSARRSNRTQDSCIHVAPSETKNSKSIMAQNDSGDAKRPHKDRAGSNNLAVSAHNEEMHSSNEYMLVLYDENKQTGTQQKQIHNQFDLELEEAIAAPPLSLSVPDLQSYVAQHINQPLRRSASSTELLYEKAMQRFYKAVELDEAEIERKLRMSAGPNPKAQQTKGNSYSEDRNKVTAQNDWLQSARTMTHLDDANAESDDEDDSFQDGEEITEISSNYDRNLRQEIFDAAQRKRSNAGREPLPSALYEDDYTDSTESTASISASLSVESIEQFMNSVRCASSSTNNIRASMNDELETYHPRMDGIRALSPYRSPEPGQATVILNKPSPLPDPDYVPKPILKRPVNESNGTIEKEPAIVVKSTPKPTPPAKMEAAKVEKIAEKPQKKEKKAEKVEKTEKRGFLQLFERKKTPSAETAKNKKSAGEQATIHTASKTPNVNEKDKKLLLDQNSLEENKVVIDHYSDLVRDLGRRDKPKVPLYMNSEALREAAERAEWEEQQAAAAVAAVAAAAAAAAAVNAIQEQQLTLTKTDDNEVIRVQELPNKLKQFQEPSPSVAESRSNSVQKDMVEISVEQTKSISYSLREIKQDPSLSSIDSTVDTDMMRKTSSTWSGSAVRSKTLARMRSTSATRSNTTATEKIDRNRSSSRADRRSQSKSPISQQRSSLTSTVLRVKRMPIKAHLDSIDIDLSPSVSPEPRCQVPVELQAVAISNVKSSLSYTTDLAMFLFACWLYMFKDARWAIPILMLMVYRQVRSAIEKKLQKWTKRKLKSN